MTSLVVLRTDFNFISESDRARSPHFTAKNVSKHFGANGTVRSKEGSIVRGSTAFCFKASGKEKTRFPVKPRPKTY